MVLKCTFSTPHGRKKELTEHFLALPPLSKGIVRRGVYSANIGKERRASITVLYELDEFRLMEVAQEIFKQIDDFSDIPGFRFSSQVWTDTHDALRSMAEVV